jgi:hypothetical protein
MKWRISKSGFPGKFVHIFIAITSAVFLVSGEGLLFARGTSSHSSDREFPRTEEPQPRSTPVPATEATVAQDAANIPADQLDSLVAPIALYPDPLLGQTLAASTYPLEIMQLQQWLERNKNLKDKALADAAAKQPWDPSVQAMAAFPDVVKRLADDLQWTTDLGNAFLAQQGDVLDAVQRMRQKAQGKGALTSNQQQTVQTQVEDGKSVIVVEPANPQVVYVPSYNPTYVYGEPAYPYPPIYYPSYAGVAAASAISFGLGVAVGAAWGGGWGWGVGWGRGDITINNNNFFNRNTNIGNIGNRTNIGGGNRWQHNPQHRGGAPYPNRGTADRFGGTTRGDSLANRQASARQQIQRQGGDLSRHGRPGAAGGVNRPGAGGGGVGGRPGAGTGGVGGRPGAGAGGAPSRPSTMPSRPSTGMPNRPSTMPSRPSVGGAGGDRVGSRNIPSNSGLNRGGFGGGSGGFNGGSARAASSRGAASMGSRGGGFSRGGGGFSRGGGGGRGGGGRRR